MPQTLAQLVRAKYPGVYDGLSDSQIETKVKAKYPGVYDDIPTTPPESSASARPEMNFATVNGQRVPLDALDELAAKISPLTEAGKGAVKGAARTAVGLGQLVHKIPGVSTTVDKLLDALGVPGQGMSSGQIMAANPQSALGLDSTNSAQKLGMLIEQIGEFMLPVGAGEKATVTVGTKLAPHVPQMLRSTARMVPRMAANAATGAGVTAAQGGNPVVGAVAGATAPIVGGAVNRGAEWIGDKAVPLVRAAVKPTVTELKRTPGASVTGIDSAVNRLARFILDNRLTTPDKAQAIIDGAERELQALVNAQPTDAPVRAVRYLMTLERSAAKQGLPASDVAMIRSAADELVKGPMGETVTTTVMRPSGYTPPSHHGAPAAPARPGLVGPNGQPVMVPTPVTTRQLRPSMPADEALQSARASSRWQTRKAWGEQKGAATEATKAVERAQRDAVKTAIPAAKPVLQREGQAIQAKKVLDRMAFRMANRDAVSLPAHVVAAGEIASGKVPLLAFAANWLRNNQMKAGILADQLSKAIARQDVQAVGAILNRLGVAGTAQTTVPAR